MPRLGKTIFPSDDEICLRQALQWLAFEIEPIKKNYEDAAGIGQRIVPGLEYWPKNYQEYENINNAITRLFLWLAKGKITSWGKKGKGEGQYITSHNRRKYWESDILETKYTEIPANFWDFNNINWDESHAWNFDGTTSQAEFDYSFILIWKWDLYKIARNKTLDPLDHLKQPPRKKSPPPPKAAATKPVNSVPTYQTPYHSLMDKAVAHFGADRLNEAKKEDIMAWLIKNGNGLVQNVAAKYMAMFIRHPTNGGPKPQKRIIKG